MSQDTVNQRLNLIVDTFEKGIKAAFARKAGISTQGAQEILAGRKGDPSFKVLVKILESYPAVDANWLVLGRGSMLHNDEASSGKTLDPFAGAGIAHQNAAFSPVTREAWQEVVAKMEEVERRLAGIDEEVIQRRAEDEVTHVLYSVTGRADAKRPYDGLLSTRLGISLEQAQQLAASGKIQVLRFGKTDDDVKGWRVSELTVRKYLGDASEQAAKK